MKKIVSALILFLSLHPLAAWGEIIIVVSPKVAWQGKVISVTIPDDNIVFAQAQFLGQHIACYPSKGVFKGIIGVPLGQKPGKYQLEINLVRATGSVETIVKDISVRRTVFPSSSYHLSPTKNKLRSPEIIADEWPRIEKYLLIESPVKLWQGKFSFPNSGRVSQGFGYKTIVNGKLSGTHLGVDIATYEGQSVLAPNRGVVVLAQNFRAFGGTMVLDHGEGIYTLYFHLSKFVAEVGQIVERGQLLALSGNTGISSGPHLHWGLSVHDLRVDPIQWTQGEL